MAGCLTWPRESTADRVEPRTVPRSKQKAKTGQLSLIGRGWLLSAVSPSTPSARKAARTVTSLPICQVSPAWFVALHTTVPQAAMSPFSASTCGLLGAKDSEVSDAPPEPATCCCDQLIDAPESP